MTGLEAAFILLGLVALTAGIACVTARNVVRAALWLVLSLGALGGCYLVLTAEFVAVVQLLIYAGAVIVLLLFGLMFTRAPVGASGDLDTGNRPVAVLAALAVAGTLIALLVDAFRLSYVDLQTVPTGSGEAIGQALFRTWVLPFEVVSVLLLAALIGAIVLSRPDVGAGGRR